MILAYTTTTTTRGQDERKACARQTGLSAQGGRALACVRVSRAGRFGTGQTWNGCDCAPLAAAARRSVWPSSSPPAAQANGCVSSGGGRRMRVHAADKHVPARATQLQSARIPARPSAAARLLHCPSRMPAKACHGVSAAPKHKGTCRALRPGARSGSHCGRPALAGESAMHAGDLRCACGRLHALRRQGAWT